MHGYPLPFKWIVDLFPTSMLVGDGPGWSADEGEVAEVEAEDEYVDDEDDEDDPPHKVRGGDMWWW